MKNNTKLKIHPKYEYMIDEVDYEGREYGYWVYLKPGYMSPDTGSHTIHEYRADEVIKALRNVQECECEVCLQQLNENINQR